MTVSSATATATYTGNGTTTAFTVPFYFLVDGDVKISQKDGATGAVTVLTLTTDYALTGAGSTSGGTANLVVAPKGISGSAPADTIYIERNVSEVQETSYPEGGPFPAASHEKAMDRLTMIAQQNTTATNLKLGKGALDNYYDVGGNLLSNMADGVAATDAATKGQMDIAVAAAAGGVPPSTIATYADLASTASGKGAALIGYLSGLSGAIARTTQGRLDDLLPTVKDFGAKGDGTTDDSAAFTAANNSGKQFIVPTGTYNIGSSITISADIVFIGAAVLAPSASAVVTINGNIEAEPRQIFDTTNGTVVGFAGLGLPGYVEWFGVKGDGTTDDHALMQIAFDAIPDIQLLARSYNMNASTLAVSPVASTYYSRRILGAGVNLTKILGVQTTQDVLKINGLNGGPRSDVDSRWVVSDLSVVNTGTSTTGGSGVSIIYSSYGTLNRFRVEACWNGIETSTVQNVLVSDGEVLFSGGSGINVQANTRDSAFDSVQVNGQKAYNDTTTGNSSGVYIYCNNVATENIEGIVFRNVRSLSSKYSLYVDGTVFTARKCNSFIRFLNCYFDTTTNGCSLNNIRNSLFDGCYFGASSASGINLQQSNGVVFANTQIVANGNHGIVIQASATFASIHNCQVLDNSTASSGTYFGINVAPGATDFQIQGNIINNTMGQSNTQGYGVYVNAGASDRYIIADNLVNGALPNLTAGISDNGTGTNKRVANNY